MRSLSFAILTATLSSLITLAVANDEFGLCCLCEECYLPASGSRFVDESGLTCDMLLLVMADPTNESTVGSSACQSLQNSFRRTCCDSAYQPPEVAQAPTPAPRINLPQGTEPLCDLCEDGAFPGRPRTVTAVLYIDGNPTCELLYYMGLYGLIEQRLCSPMQDALEKGCGCGIYDPDYTPSLPLPSPPSSSTALEPTVRPTHKPTSRPTHAPTSAPSSTPTSKPTISPTMLAPVLEVKNEPTKGTTVPLVLPTTVVVKRSSSSHSSKDDNAYKLGTGRVRGGNRG
jgi:hypothetical protein